MQIAYIHTKATSEVEIPKDELEKLPKQKYGLVTNIQYLLKLREVEKQIPNSIFAGQVVGCWPDAAERIADRVDAFLFVGSGVFHPIQVALKTGKDVWLFDPLEKKITKLDKKIIEEYKKKKKASYVKFLHAKSVGILISSKIGQNDNKITKPSVDLKMKKALELKNRKDKKYYLFAFDTLSSYDLENFNFIDCWVNTACNRIGDENTKILEIDDLFEFETHKSWKTLPINWP